MNRTRIIRYIALGIIFVVLIALGIWYATLSGRTASIERLGEARGFGEAIPSFGESIGSTFENIATGISAGQSSPQAGDEGGEPPTLWQASAVPVAGIGFVGSSSPTMRFVEKATGYVFEVDPRSGSVRRLSNTLIPKVQEALIAQSGAILLRYLDDSGRTSTFSGMLATSTDTGPLAGRELPKLISSIAFSPNGSEVFYIVPDGTGAFSGVRARADGTQQKKMISTALSGWKVTWGADGIVLSQRAASGIPGHAYAIAETSGATEPLAGGVPGLLTLPGPRPGEVLYSAASGNTIDTYARAGKNAATLSLPIRTLAEKCAWNPAVVLEILCAAPQTIPPHYLDNWYRGATHTLDVWWRIDAARGTAEQLQSATSEVFGSDPLSGASDVMGPIIDARGEYLAFLDAKDESLWLLRLRP